MRHSSQTMREVLQIAFLDIHKGSEEWFSFRNDAGFLSFVTRVITFIIYLYIVLYSSKVVRYVDKGKQHFVVFTFDKRDIATKTWFVYSFANLVQIELFYVHQ